MATLQDAPPAQNLAPQDVEDDLIDYSDDEEQPALAAAAANSAPSAEHGEDHLDIADLLTYDEHTPTLHPITVLWEDQTHSLFHCNAFNDSFFLEDDSLIDTPLATLFTACKTILHIESPASLGFYFTNLCFPQQDPVEIYEEETVCTHITLRQILDVYLQFHLNDNNTNPAPLEIEFRRRQNAVAVLQELKTAANDGIGYMQMQSIGSNDEEETGDGNDYEEEFDEEGVVQQQEPFEEQYADAEEVDSHGDESNTVQIDNVHGEAQIPGNETGRTVAEKSLQDYVDEGTIDFDDAFDEMMQGGDENEIEGVDETFEDEEVHGDEIETVGTKDTHDARGENSEEIATAALEPTYQETGHEASENAEFDSAFAEHDDGEVANTEFDDHFDEPGQHGDDDDAAASVDDAYEESGQTGHEDLAPGFDDTVEESGQNSADDVTAGTHDNYGEYGLNDSEHHIAEYNDTYNDSEQNVNENFSVSYDENPYLEPGQNDNVNATADFDDTYLESGLGFDEAPATEFGVAHDEPYDDKSQSATVQGEDALVEHALSETHNEESIVVEDETADFSDDQIDNLLDDDAQHENVQVDEFQFDDAHNVGSAAVDVDAALAGVQDHNECNDDLILDLELDFEDVQPNPAQTNDTALSNGTSSHANDEEDLIDYSDDEDNEPVKTPAASTTESQGVKRSHDLDDDGPDNLLDIKRPKIQNDTSILTT